MSKLIVNQCVRSFFDKSLDYTFNNFKGDLNYRIYSFERKICKIDYGLTIETEMCTMPPYRIDVEGFHDLSRLIRRFV